MIQARRRARLLHQARRILRIFLVGQLQVQHLECDRTIQLLVDSVENLAHRPLAEDPYDTEVPKFFHAGLSAYSG